MKTKFTYMRRLMIIAVPIMLSNLISQLQMLIDKIFLGRLDITCMSAVGNATSPIWTTMNTMFSLTVGATILTSQAIGAGDEKKAKSLISALFKFNNYLALFWFVFWLIFPRYVFLAMGVSDNLMGMAINYTRIYAPVFLMCGIGSSIISLAQVCEKTKILIVYGLVRSVLNVILDWILIFGKLGFPRLEVNGAALATTIAEFVGGIVILVFAVKSNEFPYKPALSEIISAKFSNYLSTVKMGLPTALEDFAWNFGNLYLMAMLNKISDAAAGIYSIVFGVELLPVVIVGALGNATLTLAGQETGKKQYGNIMKIVLESMFCCILLSFFILGMFLIFPGTIMSWFTTDTAILASAGAYLLVVGINMFPKSTNIIMGSGIRGYGDTKWMLGTQIWGTFFIAITSTIMVLVYKIGIPTLFYVVVADEIIRAGINTARLRYIVKKNK